MSSKRRVFCLSVLACLAVAAIPSGASAAVLYSGGTQVPVGTAISGSAVGSVKFTAGTGSFECTGATVKGSVYKNENNEGTVVKLNAEEWKYTGAGGGQCSTPWGAVAISYETTNCLSAASQTEWRLRGSACSAASSSLFTKWEFANGITCHYQRTSVTGLVFNGNYGTEPLRIANGGASTAFNLKAGENGFCPATYTSEQTIELKTGAGAGLKLL